MVESDSTALSRKCNASRPESIFLAGGDQSNYVRFWQDTPVQDGLNRYVAAGRPIGRQQRGLGHTWRVFVCINDRHDSFSGRPRRSIRE